jgi:hypothetical protein
VNTPQSDPDRPLDRLLRRSMGGRGAAAATGRCLDAEMLAAWVDGALPAADAAAAEAHASTCARCQAMLATLVRLSPPPRRIEPWWRRRWFLAGLVPLTAGAAAVAIWVATPREAERMPPASVQVAPQAPAPTQPRSSAPAAPAAQPSVPGRSEPPLVDRMATGTAREERARPIESPEAAADTRRRDEQAAAKPAPPPASAEPPAAPQLNEAIAISGLKAAVVEIASPDASVRWRIGSAGMVQRSADSGATWERLSIGASEDLTAGAAPSATVCWIVGRAGTVLLFTDGRRWQRVAFPERVDLAAVQATDSRAATVTTTGGRAFRTADGGRTWTPLQEF